MYLTSAENGLHSVVVDVQGIKTTRITRSVLEDGRKVTLRPLKCQEYIWDEV